MQIPLIYLRDKQAFRREGGALRLAGKPLDFAKDRKAEGCKLIHIIDLDAMSGLPTNLDVYDGLTYIINVQVECAPLLSLVRKLLALKCRVVLPPSFDTAGLREEKLLVARLPPGYPGDAAGFHDVVLESADDAAMERFASLGKRVMIFAEDSGKVTKKPWGVISSS